jgi:mono/diheme cytochrome c family protein
MFTKICRQPFVALAIVTGAVVCCWMINGGCASEQTRSTTAAPMHASAADQPADTAAAMATPRKSGSQLWAENCTRCHNARPPQYYSDVTWGIIGAHMRIRANLTGEEQREIVKFLQASN